MDSIDQVLNLAEQMRLHAENVHELLELMADLHFNSAHEPQSVPVLWALIEEKANELEIADPLAWWKEHHHVT